MKKINNTAKEYVLIKFMKLSLLKHALNSQYGRHAISDNSKNVISYSILCKEIESCFQFMSWK